MLALFSCFNRLSEVANGTSLKYHLPMNRKECEGTNNNHWIDDYYNRYYQSDWSYTYSQRQYQVCASDSLAPKLRTVKPKAPPEPELSLEERYATFEWED